MAAGVLAGTVIFGAAGFAGGFQSSAFAAEVTDSTAGTQPMNEGRGFGFGLNQEALLAVVADLLSIDEDTVSAALKEGQTLSALAEAYDVEEEELVEALVEAITVTIEEQVTAGTLTEEQAEQQLDNLDERVTQLVQNKGMLTGGIAAGAGGQMSYSVLALSSAILDIEEETLQASLREGQTLVEIAEEAGLSEEEFLALLLAAAEQTIEAAVTAGTLTEDQSEQQLEQLEERLAQQIEGTMGQGGAGAPGQGAGGNGQSSNGQTGGQSTTKPNTTTGTATTTNSSPTLTDISGHWAQKNIQALVDKGILTGDANKKFNPNGTVTREQIATMVAKGFELDSSATSGTTSSFSDVAANRWSSSYVEATKDYFTTSGKFEPTKEATRLEVVVTLIKAYLDSNSSVELVSSEEAETILSAKFKDATSIAAASRPYVATAVELGVVNGDSAGKFNASKTVTRAEIASMLNSILALVDSE